MAGDLDRPVLINVVQHRVHSATTLDRWPDAKRDTRLVVILQHGQPQEILDLWEGFFGPPRIDKADAAALSLAFDEAPGLF